MRRKLKNQRTNPLSTEAQLHTDYALMYEMEDKKVKCEETCRKFKLQVLRKSNDFEFGELTQPQKLAQGMRICQVL